MHSVHLKPCDEQPVVNGVMKQTLMRSNVFDVRPDDRLKLIVAGHRCIRHTRCDESHYLYIGSNKTIIIDDRVLSSQAACKFSQDLGFDNYADFYKQFKKAHRLPFEGQVVKWL